MPGRERGGVRNGMWNEWERRRNAEGRRGVARCTETVVLWESVVQRALLVSDEKCLCATHIKERETIR